MENSLYDELLQEIFRKLPSSSSPSVSLVCKRWLHLYRSSRTALSLRLAPHFSLLPSLSSFLSHHPFLSSLSLSLSPPFSLSPQLLSLVSSSCSNLIALSVTPGPVSLSFLLSLSTTCPRLTSLCITLPRPVFLNWLSSFPCLKELSISLSSDDDGGNQGGVNSQENEDFDTELELELGLESLCLVGIRGVDWGLGWLWRRCTKLKKLRLQSCQGIGGSYSSFVNCLQGLNEIELRTCRSVVYGVLLELLEHCGSLNSLLVHDGGSREGLLQFFTQCRSKVLKLDIRLPLDLSNDHLLAVAANFHRLTSLRLQSCCLVTGEGLKALAVAMSGGGLEELALVNCDVVEREPGLLATLGQHLRHLRKLDLSHNEMLLDKEFVSMLVSCVRLIDLRVRGCKGLTSAAIVSMLRSCKQLESVDIMHCFGIDSEAVELFVKNSARLRRMEVEGSKLSDAAKMWASTRKSQLVAHVLSRRHFLLAMLETKLLGFEHIKELYLENEYFKETYELCANATNRSFYRHDGFLFKDKSLCVSKSSIKELLMKETHEGGLMGHFGEYKTDSKFLNHFLRILWSKLDTNILFSTACCPQTDGQIEANLGRISRGHNHAMPNLVEQKPI
ncbi:grrA, partial [Mucuna pruriens]